MFALRFLTALREELVYEADIRRDSRVALAESRENRRGALEHEPIVLGSRDEDVAWLDAQAPTQRRGHHKPSLGADCHLDHAVVCHCSVQCASLATGCQMQKVPTTSRQ